MAIGEIVLGSFLASFFQVLSDKLTSSALSRAQRDGINTVLLEEWKNMLVKINAVSADAEYKQLSGNHQVKLWLDKVKDLAYDMEDLLDEFAIKAAQIELEAKSSTSKGWNFSIFGRPPSLMSKTKIQEINDRLEEIVTGKVHLNLRENVVDKSNYTSKRITTSLLEPQFFGREEDVEQILELLINEVENSNATLSIVPIVGMGGIGKTALAQQLYNDARVNRCFEMRAWVCVSDVFDVLDITKTILRSITRLPCEGKDLNEFQGTLRDNLSGKKFLVVLDDIWNDNYERWTTLLRPFEAGARGSKIIVTTRNLHTVFGKGDSPYFLKELSPNNCASLLAFHAFNEANFENHPELETIGKKIAEKCEGLPLVAKMLGNALCNKKKLNEWEDTLTKITGGLSMIENGVLPILKLSYIHLPPYLKRCFSYCAVFPKDYEIERDELVLLWIVEGFLDQQKTDENKLRLGQNYFNELVSRSFLQQSSVDASKFLMHDLLNDLAKSIEGGTCFNSEESQLAISEYDLEKARHASFFSSQFVTSKCLTAYHKMKVLRSLILARVGSSKKSLSISNKVLHDLLSNLKYLRVLSICHCDIVEVPNCVGELKHLRYLNFSYTYIKRLLESIVGLCKLQALILRGCRELSMLPQGITKLVNLQFLDIRDTKSLKEMPLGISNLKNLTILSKFVVGTKKGLQLGELNNLSHLQGELFISELQNVKEVRDCVDAKLSGKEGLSNLFLQWNKDFGEFWNDKHYLQVLTSLQPHTNLENLTISYYGGAKFPSWLNHPSYSKIKTLCLQSCPNVTSLPSLGQLPSLKELSFEGLDAVRRIGSEFYGGKKPFSSLTTLKFKKMLAWKDWSPYAGGPKEVPFSCLEHLVVRSCPSLVGTLPCQLNCLIKLEIYKCQQLNNSTNELCLPSLNELYLEDCSKDILKSLFKLTSLTVLKINKLIELVSFDHRFMSCLGKLRKLHIGLCDKLTCLWQDGNETQNLTCLQELTIKSCAQFTSFVVGDGEIELPCNLERMELVDCTSLEKLPIKMHALRHLVIENCPKIMALNILQGDSSSNNSISQLESLKIRCCDSSISFSFAKGRLAPLKALDIYDYKGVESLEGIAVESLETMTINICQNMGSLPQCLHMLSQLTQLSIWNCRASEIEDFPSLPITLSSLDLNIMSPRLKKYPLDVPTLLQLASLSYLEELGLRPLNPKPLVQLLSSYYSWINLLTLEFFQCEVGAIPLERLPQLKKLIVDGCKQLERLSIPLELRRLCQAWVSRCPELVEIQVVGSSKSLESLRVSRCKSLIRIGGLSDLKNLEELVIQRCIVLANVEGLHELKSLKSLVIKKCTSLRWLIDASCTNIPANCLIEIWGCGDFIKRDVTFLKRYREEILLDTTNKSKERMKDEARPGAADMETSDRNYAMAAVQKLVGIDDRVKQITKLLEMEVIDDVRIIGIYGTDGIGKTTLAKAVYDRTSSCFDSCSFLAEVNETTQNSCDIRYLQTKLIRDILALDREDPSCDERMEIFVDIFRKMKVLIVVDGVENQSYLHAIVGDQLHWFGLGSRIIVTSQNEEILKEYDPEKTRTYMVSELDDGQAFELFCKHAFTMSSQYDGLADRIVNATEKLPLAVEVVGSFLRGRSIQEWEKMEKLMKLFSLSSQKTTVGLEEILDICYKELDQQQKNIFLDIACFISDADAQIASYMWPDCYLPSSGCILMPLAKIGENNELQMHRLLRCLGKRIIEQEGSGDPSSRRFCTQDMVLEAMNREKGIENVEACDSFILTATNFASMPAISFLKLDDAKVSGDFTGAFQSLRWLCWQRCPSEFDVINFVLRELVILDLSWSKVTEDWRGWSEIKMEKLKVLNLTGCSDLLITPNFSDYKDLEILILERCSRLVKLDPSIGHLKRLVSLNMKFCSQLNGLPVELGCTTALKELFIDGTCVRQIPISIGNLKQLKILSGFQCFPLTYLPSSICYLISLSELSLDGAKISELPSSLGKLLDLRRLSLRDCRYLENLPYSIGEMGSLEELDISATSISEFPDSIRNLKSLKVLRMDSSFIRAFPREIGNLTKLEELHASWCQSLKGAIPRDIKRLCHLRSLTLGHTSISSIPPEISTISSLQTLDLLQCNEIEVLPELPPSLICLHVSSKRMKDIPLLKDLKELEELYLSDEDPEERQPPSKQLKPESKVKQLSIWFSRLWNLELLQTQSIEKQSFSIVFPKLRKLELSLSRIIKLEFLYEPTDIPQLKTLRLSGLSLEEVSELPKTLSVLSIRGCSSLKRLPIVQSLINISAFELYHSAIEEIYGLEGLKSLKRLQISNCKIQHLNGIFQLTSLRSLIVSDCDYLDSLPDLSNLKLLKVLEIRQCKMIHQIEGLEELKYLEKLKISECPAENSAQIQNVLELVMARSVVA